MDKAIRTEIQRATHAARALLENDFGEQLEGAYSIRQDGTIAPEPGGHLNAEERLVRHKLVAAVEQLSEHPIGLAIVAGAKARGLTPKTATAFAAVNGLGVQAAIDGQSVLVGSGNFLAQRGVATQPWEARAEAWRESYAPHPTGGSDAHALAELGRVTTRFSTPISSRADLVAALEVVVLPSRSEGLPFALLEAMALGKPVVATTVGGCPEVVEHGRTGLLTPPGDPPALADAILRLLECPGEARAMGEAGAARVRADFTLTRMVRELEAIYAAALAARGLR